MAIIVKDTFTRANNTNTLGFTETGQEWKYINCVWGIYNNQAYAEIGNEPLPAYVDAGKSDGVITIRMPTVNDNYACMFRLVHNSDSDFSFYLLHTNPVRVQYFNSSSWYSTVASTSIYGQNGDTYKIELVGNKATVFRNGQQVLVATLDKNLNATKHGLTNWQDSWRSGGYPLGLWDDFIIEDIDTGGTPTAQDGSATLLGQGTISTVAQKLMTGQVSLVGAGQLAANAETISTLPTQTLSPDAIMSVTNLTGTVDLIQDDPSKPDANWLVAPATTSTALRVSFPNPSGRLTGEQIFRVLVRRNTSNPSGTGTPTVNLGLRITGGSSNLATTTNTTLTDNNNVVISMTWDSANYPTVLADGSNVELYVAGTQAGSSTNRRTVEIGSVSWTAKYIKGSVTDGEAAAAGSGVIEVSGKVLKNGIASLTTQGLFSANSLKIINNQTDLKGTGSLTASSVTIKDASTSLLGQGIFSAFQLVIKNAQVNLMGLGTLTANAGGISVITGSASLLSQGKLDVNGQREVSGSSNLLGQGNLTVDSKKERLGQSTINGQGLLSTNAKREQLGASPLQGQGQFSIDGKKEQLSGASLQSQSLFSATAKCTTHGSVNILGQSLFEVSTRDVTIITASADLVSTGQLLVDAVKLINAQVDLKGTGKLVTDALKSINARADINGTGLFNATSQRIQNGSVDLNGQSILNADSNRIVNSQADILAFGQLVAEGYKVVIADASLIGSGKLIILEGEPIIGTIRLQGKQTLNVYLVGEQSLNVNLQGKQSLNVNLKGLIN